jgi:hypothetical protein
MRVATHSSHSSGQTWGGAMRSAAPKPGFERSDAPSVSFEVTDSTSTPSSKQHTPAPKMWPGMEILNCAHRGPLAGAPLPRGGSTWEDGVRPIRHGNGLLPCLKTRDTSKIHSRHARGSTSNSCDRPSNPKSRHAVGALLLLYGRHGALQFNAAGTGVAGGAVRAC